MAGEIRFYTDEHIHKAIIRALRRVGADVLSTPEAGTLGATDDQHLTLASNRGRVLVTQDRDFLRLNRRGFPHAGIAYADTDTSISRMINGLILIYEVLEPEDMIGRVEYI